MADKVQHFALTLLAVVAVGLLVLAYRDRARVALTDQLGTLMTIFVGVALGMLWEIVEFISDWVLNTSLQPSNTDTMMKLLASDLAAVVGALLAARLYCHALSASQRQRLGELSMWLSDGPSHALDRHGFAITLGFGLLMAGAVAALWFAGRPVPGFPIS